jgi:hypothetical protein
MMCDDDASTTKRLALLGPLDEFDFADAEGVLPTIFPERAGGGGGGEGGLRPRYLAPTEGSHRGTRFFLAT